MREVKKWNKDYRTGEIVEKMVVKNNDGLQGRATIQLFDKEGNLVNETFTENIIHDVYGDELMYRQLFQITCGNSVPSMGGGGTANFQQSFQTMILSTDDAEESEEKIAHWGDVIGFCPRSDTNAGSDAKRGVYNPTESWSKITEDGYRHYHLVYDFGTSQGNGTFNSVIWTPPLQSNYREKYYYPFFLRTVKNMVGNLTAKHIVTDKDGNYYKTNSNRDEYYRITNLEKYLNGYEALKTSPNNERSTYIRPEFWIGTTGEYVASSGVSHTTGSAWSCKFTLTHRGKSEEEIHKLEVSDIETLVPDLRTYMDKITRSDRYFKLENVWYVGYNGDVLMTFYGYNGYGSGSHFCFPTYDSGTNTVDKGKLTYFCRLGGVYNVKTKSWKVTPSFTSESMGYGYWLNHNKSYLQNVIGRFNFEGRELDITISSGLNPFIQYNPSTFKYTTIGGGNLGYNPSNANMMFSCYIKELKAFYPYNVDNSNYAYYNGLAKIMPMSAHTKLPKPVTKTNADTMKVQYDYLVQIPNIFNLDGDYLRMSGE